MRNFAVALAVFASSLTATAHASQGSAGIVLAIPEIIGGFVSIYATPRLAVDLKLTLATADAGLTVRTTGRVWDFLISGAGGYVHSAVHGFDSVRYRGPHATLLLGFGYFEGIDLRMQGGVGLTQDAYGNWGAGPVLSLMWGLPF